MIKHDKCPLCFSERISLFLRCSDHFLSKEEFPLFKCSSCGFVFLQEYPDEREITRYYDSEDYISHDDNAKGFLNKGYLVARDIMLKRKLKIVEQASGNRNSKILDIGCGTGYFLGTMKKAGWETTGIEPNKKARDYGINNFGLNILPSEKIASLSDGSFDCITMWHVLEHLYDPFRYASEIIRLLKHDGICFVALPNSNSADARYYKEFWSAYDLPRHLWHFNPETFNIFSKKTGFKITKSRILPLDVFYISILSEKYRGSRAPFLKGLLTSGLFMIKSAINKSLGSSLIYYLRKSENQ